MLTADCFLVNVTDKDVAYVADLANLDLTEAERQRMVRDLNSILGYIDRLNELNTDNVPPMAHTAAAGRSGDALRNDELRPCLPHQAALENAPDHDENFFKVPKVIEK
ncbi:MAG TPA: Asp-tRNA(Asn)/Glu-tRNA(Gln) amidotransferase subunit GatC [Candidatus Angelobacter sp.]|nr:Asp-tRNA(Asn)/Glu-tRNA(Gln) amidotransferase subunit GatC [Candidatus Angelobacter sp.]